MVVMIDGSVFLYPSSGLSGLKPIPNVSSMKGSLSVCPFRLRHGSITIGNSFPLAAWIVIICTALLLVSTGACPSRGSSVIRISKNSMKSGSVCLFSSAVKISCEVQEFLVVCPPLISLFSCLQCPNHSCLINDVYNKLVYRRTLCDLKVLF